MKIQKALCLSILCISSPFLHLHCSWQPEQLCLRDAMSRLTCLAWSAFWTIPLDNRRESAAQTRRIQLHFMIQANTACFGSLEFPPPPPFNIGIWTATGVAAGLDSVYR